VDALRLETGSGIGPFPSVFEAVEVEVPRANALHDRVVIAPLPPFEPDGPLLGL
jgi:hypothetical protein